MLQPVLLYTGGFSSLSQGIIYICLNRGEVCAAHAGQRIGQRDLASVTVNQTSPSGRYGATQCRLHSLKAETPVWSAGHCQAPDNEPCSAVSIVFIRGAKD